MRNWPIYIQSFPILPAEVCASQSIDSTTPHTALKGEHIPLDHCLIESAHSCLGGSTV